MRKEIIRLDRLTVEDHGYNYLSNVSFYVEENEIVGILGQFNSGRRELAEIICGIRTWIDPHIYISEKQQTKWDKKIAVSNGNFLILKILKSFLRMAMLRLMYICFGKKMIRIGWMPESIEKNVIVCCRN